MKEYSFDHFRMIEQDASVVAGHWPYTMCEAKQSLRCDNRIGNACLCETDWVGSGSGFR